MRIKFIKVEEGLEGRGKKATGKVSRAVTGHVVTPSGGKVGVDDDPKNPTKRLKKMVRKSYKAKAENSSTEILGNKMVEGFDKLFQEATISKSRGNGKGEIVKDVKLSPGARKAMEKRGKKVPGGYSVPSKGNRLPTEIAEATAKGVSDAAKKRKDSFTKTSYNPRAHDNDETTYVPGKRSSTTVAKVKGGVMVGREGPKGYRIRKVSDSTEILGNKIVEGFNRLLNEGGISNWLAQGARQAIHHAGDVASRNIEKGLPKIKAGVKAGAKWLAKKGMYGAGKLTGMAIRGGKKLWNKYAQNSSTELFGNKIVEGFNQFLDRMDELSPELKARAAKAAKKKAKEHAKIASAAGKVKARDTEVIHDKISRSKKAQADRFEGKAGGEDKVGKRAYHQAKKEAGIGTRIIPVRKR